MIAVTDGTLLVPASPVYEWSRDYIHRRGQLLAAAEPDTTGERKIIFHLDHLGSARQITTTGGIQIAFHSYYPFGAEATDPAQDEISLKFGGHQRDSFTAGTGEELDYVMARYSSPSLGRFLAPDPISPNSAQFSQGLNRYAYVSNNPIKFIDPDGQETQLVIGYETEGNLFGHFAITVDGTVFSYGTEYAGNGEDWGVPLDVYLRPQKAKRLTEILTLWTTPEEETSLLEYLQANDPNEKKYSVFNHSCVTVSEKALEYSGLLENQPGEIDVDRAGNLMQEGAPMSLTPMGLRKQIVNAPGKIRRWEFVGNPQKRSFIDKVRTFLKMVRARIAWDA